MGYLKKLETDRLTLPSNPEYWVLMKRRAAWGDSSAAQSALVHASLSEVAKAQQQSQANGSGIDPELQAKMVGDVISEVETDAYMQMLVCRLIVEWNLTDEEDRPLPITPQTVALIDPEDGEYLALEAQKRRGGRPAAQQRPFEKPSGQRSTATRSTTPKPSE